MPKRGADLVPATAIVVVGTVPLILAGPGIWLKAAVLLAAVSSALVVWLVGSRWPALLLLLWGIAGTALGIAVGLRHLIGGGLTLVSLAACVALGAGLYLLVAGSVRLLRGLRRLWRIAGAAGIAVVTILGLYVLILPLLVTQPLPAAAPGAPPPGFTEVAFTTADGVQLAGWYAETGNGAAIVVVPGSGSSRAGAAAQAEVLAGAGHGVLLYDPRGHGTSAGRAMDLGWAGDLDVNAAVTFAAAQPGVRTIGALGLSMGGEQVLGAAASDPHIRAVVAEGATNRVAADLRWLPAQYGARGSLQLGLERMKQAVTQSLTPYPAPAPLAQTLTAIAPRPVLLIAAGDRPDEGLAAADMAQGITTAQIWEVPGAGHVGALTTDGEQWRRRVVGFFDRALL